MPTHSNSVNPRGTRHTKEDALSDRQFQLLLEGANEMRDYYGQQARFVILLAGRLGLRAGEIAHMDDSWLDWRRNMITIPRYDPCQKGSDSGPCGYCRQQAQQRVKHADDLTLDEALQTAWSAKTEAAARDVPWDFEPRVALTIERFFEQYDEWPVSRQGVNRRVQRAAEEADGVDSDNVYPHALRATAATYHAARGLDVLPLQSLFGWSDLKTAQRYIQSSGENTARALHMVHTQ